MTPGKADVAMFRPMPSVGLGRRWHVPGRRLNGFMLSAPCGFVQADNAVRDDRDEPSEADRHAD